MLGAISTDNAPARPTASHPLAGPFWTGEGATFGAMLAAGAATWLLYAIVQVLVNGIVFDEIVVPAQIITGAVHYPAGHPHGLYFPRLLNLQNYVAALAWLVLPSAAVMSAIGNVLFVLAATFVPFAITVALTRRPAWGHVAVALMLTDTTTRFNGSYVMWVFPHFSTHGHLGLHFALLIPVLLVGGLWRTSGLFLGLLPVIHIAMATVVWPFAAIFLWIERRRLPRATKRQFSWYLAAGLGITAALATYILATTPIRLAPPYDVPFDGELIYRLFTTTTDGHRQPFHVASFAYLVSPVAFFSLGYLLLRRWSSGGQRDAGPQRRAAIWLLGFGALVWAYIYGAWAVESLTGWLPELVQMTMPFRLSNMSATMLMPLTIATVAAAWDRVDDERGRTRILLVAALVVLSAGVLAAYDKYLAFSHVMYVALGLAVAVNLFVSRQVEPSRTRVAAAVFGGLTILLAFMYFAIGTLVVVPFLAAAAVCLAMLFAAPHSGPRAWLRNRQVGYAALIGCCVATAALATPGDHVPNNWDATEGHWYQQSSFDTELNQWLSRHSAPDEMLLVAMWPRSAFQVVTGHPVMADIDTLMMVTYMKSLAGAVNLLARDLYGIDYSNEAQIHSIVNSDGMVRPTSSVWLDAWKNRSRQEWQRLGSKYGFRLVIAPRQVPIDLPVAIEGAVWTLHVIANDGERGQRN
jgi:hypothetical protein